MLHQLFHILNWLSIKGEIDREREKKIVEKWPGRQMVRSRRLIPQVNKLNEKKWNRLNFDWKVALSHCFCNMVAYKAAWDLVFQQFTNVVTGFFSLFIRAHYELVCIWFCTHIINLITFLSIYWSIVIT